MTDISESTYLWKQCFSKMSIMRNTFRNQFTDERLESCYFVATSPVLTFYWLKCGASFLIDILFMTVVNVYCKNVFEGPN